jgi:hypothetical protein
MRDNAQVFFSAILFLFSSSYYLNVNADDEVSADEDYSLSIGHNFSLGVAIGNERFDTNLRVTDLSSGNDVFVDMEGTVGLPETDTIPIIYGYYRVAEKHAIGFSYYQAKRDGTVFAFDENLGDLNVTGSVSLSDRTTFYYASYNYTAYEDDRAYVFASFGLHGLDLKYNLTAEGDLTYRGFPIASNQFERTSANLPRCRLSALTRGSRLPLNGYLGRRWR